jgi:hypothetical protein
MGADYILAEADLEGLGPDKVWLLFLESSGVEYENHGRWESARLRPSLSGGWPAQCGDTKLCQSQQVQG